MLELLMPWLSWALFICFMLPAVLYSLFVLRSLPQHARKLPEARRQLWVTGSVMSISFPLWWFLIVAPGFFPQLGPSMLLYKVLWALCFVLILVCGPLYSYLARKAALER
jgi:hypothetical protein